MEFLPRLIVYLYENYIFNTQKIILYTKRQDPGLSNSQTDDSPLR